MRHEFLPEREKKISRALGLGAFHLSGQPLLIVILILLVISFEQAIHPD
jgi:hypothetical protein